MKWAPLLLSAMAPNAAVAADRIALPDQISHPEGIALDPANRTAYLASAVDGKMAAVDLATGKARAIGDGIAAEIGNTFPGVLGMRYHGGTLWAAGGNTTKIFQLDARTGALLRTISTQTGAPGLINDLAIVGNTAYFTDTRHPVLWSVNLDKPEGAAKAWLSFDGTQLAYAEGANLNGIVATHDGRSLIVGQMTKGLLFRIDIATRAVTPIDLGAERVEGVDGLVLQGDTLFVVRQPAAEIVTIRLSADVSSGTVVKRSKPEGLQWPATAAIDGDALLVVNSQFNRRTQGDAERPFNVLRVPLSTLTD